MKDAPPYDELVLAPAAAAALLYAISELPAARRTPMLVVALETALRRTRQRQSPDGAFRIDAGIRYAIAC